MFRAFYESFWQHPFLLFAATFAGLAVALLRRHRVHPTVVRAALGLGALQLLDAWLTTSNVPGLGPLPSPWGTIVPITFVILGDYRYLVAVHALRPDGRVALEAKGALRAWALAFVVPATSQLIVALVPASGGPRFLFLSYEFLFLLLILARWRFVGRRLAPRALRWHRALDRLALAWYGTWVLADVWILAFADAPLADVGYLLRVVPNALYYGAMPAVLVLAAPEPT